MSPLDFVAGLIGTLSLDRILEDPGRAESPAYLGLMAAFGLALVAGLVLVNRSHAWAGGNTLHEVLIRRYGTWLMWLGTAGAIAVTLRYSAAPFLSKRLWTWMAGAGGVALAAHFAWYHLFRYQRDVERYQQEDRRRRSLPAPRTTARSRQPRRG